MTPEQKQAEAARLFDQGLEEYYRSQYRQGLQSWQQALVIYQEIGDRRGEGSGLGNLGSAYYSLGQYQLAINYHQQHLTISREIGDRSGEFYGLNNLAIITYNNLQQIPQALETWQSALALSSPLEFPVQYLLLGRNLGDTAFEVENWQLAIMGYEATLDALEELCHRDRSEANKQHRRRENVRVYASIVWSAPQPALEKGEKDDQSGFRADYYWQSKPEAVTAVVELRDRYLKTYNSKTDIWENQLEPFLEELAEILKIQYILSKIPAHLSTVNLSSLSRITFISPPCFTRC